MHLTCAAAPEKFASIFLGDFDTPEVIWGPEMRSEGIIALDQSGSSATAAS